MSFPSITNNHEFFSDHYLEAIIANDLKGLRSDWDAREERGEHTPRKGVRALRTPFDKLKQDAEAATVDRGTEPLQDLHDAVLTALGYEPNRQAIETTRGEVVTVVLPVVHATTLPTGLRLVALETTYAASCDEALGSDVELIDPLVLDGDAITEPAKAISLAFTVDDPPRHVLLLAGATLVLCARDSWPEGRFLAVDLDLALGRNDTKAKGELDTIAALFSRDALVPGETGEAIIDELGASSLKQAVGVSADLREGVRRSVEDVANEIVTQRLAKNLRVYNEPDVARRLARESLRFLYRILFLLYAEARPELGIVPSLAEGYRDGYGLDRLRELALTELTTEHANNGTHLHDSLDILFALVNDGYHHEFAQQQFTESGDAIDDTGLIFEPLHSELFGPNATPLLDSIRLRNEVVQAVLARLLLTQEKSGRERRFVSYATLGINQLGAVYEGLMAYTGLPRRRGPARGAQTRLGGEARHLGRTGRESRRLRRRRLRHRDRRGRHLTPSQTQEGFVRVPPLGPRSPALGVLLHARGAHALRRQARARGAARPGRRDHERRRAARPHDLRAGARLGRVPQRGDQPALGRVPRAQAERARGHDRPRQVRGRAPEGQDALRAAPELRRRPQRDRRRAGRGVAVAQRHAPGPASAVVRPAPAPRQLADRRAPCRLSATRSLLARSG